MSNTPAETPPPISEPKKVLNRLKRARGQLDAVITAIENGAPCDEIITQLSAAHSAVRRTAFVVVAGAMRDCAINPNHTHNEEDMARLEKLFLSLS